MDVIIMSCKILRALTTVMELAGWAYRWRDTGGDAENPEQSSPCRDLPSEKCERKRARITIGRASARSVCSES